MQQPQDEVPKQRDPMPIAVVSLGITQIISWGTSLYALGVLGKPISVETGWSPTVVFGGLTVGLLVSSVVSTSIGRTIDARGARAVMTLGTLLMVVFLFMLSLVTSPGAYLAVWALLGLAMRMTLYDAAFAALAQVTPTRARRAISYLTLFGGVASTTFWMIGHWLEVAYGWRATLQIFALINFLFCTPLHWWGLARREAVSAQSSQSAAAPGGSSDGPLLEGRAKFVAMLLFGWVMAASAFVYGAMAAHLVTAIAATGLGLGAAVTLASLKGVAQTGARSLDIVFGKNLHPVNLGRLTLAALPVAFLILFAGDASFATALAFTILFGAANGLSTIVRGAVPLALFGTRGYGEILGILATPYLVLNAIAPVGFSMFTESFGVAAGNALLAAVGALSWVSMEIMARWYRGQRARSQA